MREFELLHSHRNAKRYDGLKIAPWRVGSLFTLGGFMKASQDLYLKLLVSMSLALAASIWAPTANASTSLGLGFSYSSGNPISYGVPVMGYGAAGASFGAIGNVCGGGYGAAAPILIPQPSTCSVCQIPRPAPIPYPAPMPYSAPSPCACSGGLAAGPAYPSYPVAPAMPAMPALPSMPALPPLPPPPPVIPPHIALGNMNWGQPWNSYQQLAVPGYTTGSNCVPCSIGMQPQPVYPVAGGPYVSGGFEYSQVRNEWQKNDTADIVFATAIGLGMQTSNVYPVAVPRYDVTTPMPLMYGTDDRSSVLIPRPHVAP
jgi:hypothetical protein